MLISAISSPEYSIDDKMLAGEIKLKGFKGPRLFEDSLNWTRGYV